MGFPKIFAGIAHEAAKIASDVKSAIVKAVNAVPAILQTVEREAPEVAALLNVVHPGLGSVVPTALSIAEDVASVIKQGGTAAETNLLNAGFDQDFVNGVKSLIATLEHIGQVGSGTKTA